MHFRRTLALLVSAFSLSALGAEPADYPIRPVPFTAVQVRDEFWSPRLETNRKVTVWYDFEKCAETGRLDNFAKAAGLMPGEFRGTPWDDSDVYKVIEGAAYTLAIQPDGKLEKFLDDLIAKIAAAQEPDGYLYTARRLLPPEKMAKSIGGPKRWSKLGGSHEMYCLGHLYEAAVAHNQATRKRTLLDVATKSADLLVREFGPGKIEQFDGHPEVELALVKLYRATGKTQYLDLAKFFVGLAGKRYLETGEALGHCVRFGYLCSGAADVAALTGDKELMARLDRVWESMVARKIYLTGGIGICGHGEGFGDDYQLPNADAYTETCAAIANGLWNYRMFLRTGEAKYLDLLERIAYNGFLAGLSLGGDRFFYPNPLEVNGRRRFNHGSNERAPWFGCSCCPVNVVRYLPELPGCAYAVQDGSIYVNLFLGGSTRMPLSGQEITLTQETRYPWEGKVNLHVEAKQPSKFDLRIRIPGWSQGWPVPSDLYRYLDAKAEPVRIRVNGQVEETCLEKGFAVLKRTWRTGDRVELDLPMPVRHVVSHKKLATNTGRVAIERGPVVYCAEAIDNGPEVLSLVLADSVSLTPRHEAKLLGGVTVLEGQAEALFADKAGKRLLQARPIRMVPYYAWNNRGPGAMAVWIARQPEYAKPVPPPTLASQARISVSFVDAKYHNEPGALADGEEPKNSCDHSIPRFTWWPHKGATEWVQYDFATPQTVSSASLYWFDDTGRGGCRVPKSARLLYREGSDWKAVPTGEIGTRVDAWNKTAFSPLKTPALRVEVQLQPGFSSGILEWKVE